MNTVSPKVAAGAGAAGMSVPLGQVVVWGLGLLGVAVPPDIAMAIAGLMAAAASAVVGYLVPHSAQVN